MHKWKHPHNCNDEGVFLLVGLKPAQDKWSVSRGLTREEAVRTDTMEHASPSVAAAVISHMAPPWSRSCFLTTDPPDLLATLICNSMAKPPSSPDRPVPPVELHSPEPTSKQPPVQKRHPCPATLSPCSLSIFQLESNLMKTWPFSLYPVSLQPWVPGSGHQHNRCVYSHPSGFPRVQAGPCGSGQAGVNPQCS